jgi:alpha-tubulin suppressor-like RCC1 family protein
VTGLSQVASTSGSAGHRCAALTTLALKCWGRNQVGQLGDGTTTNRKVPVAVTSLAGTVRAVVARGSHTCALVTGARVKCWGENNFGQLGDGTTTFRATPGFVSSLTNVDLIGGGAGHTCARTTSGAVKCWGRNNFGQLGDGTQVDRHTPVANPIASAVSLQGGTTFSAARRSSGGIRTWGQNNVGQLGTGNTTPRSTPGAVSGLS